MKCAVGLVKLSRRENIKCIINLVKRGVNALKLGMKTETLEFKKSTGEMKEAMISIFK